ncbi:MAG TPA: transglycosylase SLT domain-containing protein, partial [Polyangiaceae bacterium]|nr:transglycosylase SLT domain-containing protein [Polyangiaceae bacterium]
ELATLRRAESEMFGQLDVIMEELSVVSRKLDGMERRDTRESSRSDSLQPRGSQDFWQDLRLPTLSFSPNPKLEKYIRFFTESASGRKMFVTWLKRSGKYRDIILSSLREHGLPPDLIAVVFIESGFQPKAVSSAGATGLWQFMPKTGRAYGLSVTPRVDERRSIWSSTDAAARHLSDLFAYFQSWELALAAYNYGYERLASLSERMGSRDFWTLSAVEGALPRETVLYVPKVLAVAVILNNLDRFDMANIEWEPALSGAALQVPGGTRLSLVARAAGTSVETIRSLNPEFPNDLIPHRDSPYIIRIPANGLARARVMLPRLLEDPRLGDDDIRTPAGFDWGRDDPDPGVFQRLSETRSQGALRGPSQAASSYFLEAQQEPPPAAVASAPSVSDAPMSLMSQEPESRGSTPLSSSLSSYEPSTENQEASQRVSQAAPRSPSISSGHGGKRRMKARSDREILYFVMSEQDTLQAVATRFGVDEGELRAMNRFGRRDIPKAGTLLRIPVQKSEFPSGSGAGSR